MSKNNDHTNVPAIYDMICFAFCTEEKCANCGNGGCTCDVWYNWCDDEPSIKEAYDTVKNEIEDGKKNNRGYDCHSIWKSGSDMKAFIRRHYEDLDKFLDMYNADNGPCRAFEPDDPWLAKQAITLQKVKEYVTNELAKEQ